MVPSTGSANYLPHQFEEKIRKKNGGRQNMEHAVKGRKKKIHAIYPEVIKGHNLLFILNKTKILKLTLKLNDFLYFEGLWNI